ncbi:transglutaminase-like domain-containing protein [Aureibacter tunicatorum]|uniref:Transglutaminase-like domain-containing protein n=1 Tax=Aureibacter tunicatorum TaxID=866807 RepID=A0AAE4BS40_9BACT|nr:transglutaminase-like domain-containing protein [Aureibacter tunicatorum]MDR6238480.1 hypothetical protein [Aureibacter tunicatorum]BDD05587.1 hypothetical protein AUTU_30700 [Aureibacter tunicatorum]
MIKATTRAFLILLTAFTLFSFWLSPRLGGLISMGKDFPDQSIEQLHFTSASSDFHSLQYHDVSNRIDLITLRTKYSLDSLIENCPSDFEKVKKVQSWVQSRWMHDSHNMPKENSALYILEQAKKGEKFRCVEYSLVAKECLLALGFKIRSLGLMTKDISEVKSYGGHIANEIYLDDLEKWMFIDPQFDVITTKNGMPLNAVELQQCIAQNIPFEIINPNKTTTTEKYKQWIGPYLYYFYVSINGQQITIWDRIIGNKKQLTLLSTTADKPKYFQKIIRINNSYYTNSTEDFYPSLSKIH